MPNPSAPWNFSSPLLDRARHRLMNAALGQQGHQFGGLMCAVDDISSASRMPGRTRALSATSCGSAWSLPIVASAAAVGLVTAAACVLELDRPGRDDVDAVEQVVKLVVAGFHPPAGGDPALVHSRVSGSGPAPGRGRDSRWAVTFEAAVLM